MKPRDTNLIDALLRSLAGNQSGRSAQHETSEEITPANTEMDFHLDPDEISCYAEGVLPPTVRLRYSAHLADCARCRNLVTQVALASGISHLPTEESESERQRFWLNLSALFSPAVLRFAIPALAILGVLFVGIVFFRQDRGVDYVADSRSGQQNVASPQPALTQGPTEKGPEPSSKTESINKEVQKPLPSPHEINRAAGDKASGEKPHEEGKNSVATVEPSYAPEPEPPPASKTRTDSADEQPQKAAEQDTGQQRDKEVAQDKLEGNRQEGRGQAEAGASSRNERPLAAPYS